MKKAVAQIQSIEKESIYVVSAFALLLSLFALYIYFVSASVLHVVMRQEMERRSSTLHSEIATLEARYIDMQHAMSEDIAARQGYVAASDKIYINRGGAAVALSERNE